MVETKLIETTRYIRFSSPGPMGDVRYCHHLVSVLVVSGFVVHKLLHFNLLPLNQLWTTLKQLGQLELTVVGTFAGWSPTKFMFYFVHQKYTKKKQEARRCQKGVSIYMGIHYLLLICFNDFLMYSFRKSLLENCITFFM